MAHHCNTLNRHRGAHNLLVDGPILFPGGGSSGGGGHCDNEQSGDGDGGI